MNDSVDRIVDQITLKASKMKPEKRKNEHSVNAYLKPGMSIKIKSMAQEKGISISKTVVQLLTFALKQSR